VGRPLTRYALPAAGAIALLAAPFFAGEFQVTLLTQSISWGVLALAVWLLLRICDLPSFGHAAFFGVGAYTAGLAVTRWQIGNVFVALALAIGVSCLVALPIAIVAARLKAISFLLVTLAFASMLQALAGRWSPLGGSDGLVGAIRPDAGPLPIDLFDPHTYYYFSLGVLAAALLVLLLLVHSPFGGVLKGIRESEVRMSALGYNPTPYRVAAFVVSGGIAGAAGVLSAYLTSFVDPGDVGALVSARGLLLAVIGGTSVFGPPVAAIALTELENLLSSHTDHWLGAIGVVYILVALLPLDRKTLGGLLVRLRGAVLRRAAADPPSRPLAPAKEAKP
jgi:branched-chain amino acid transport system permease protein